MENTVVLKGPVEYIKEAIKIYFKKENLIFFIKVMSIPVITTALISYLTDYLYPSDVYVNGLLDGNRTAVIIIILNFFAIFSTFWAQTSSLISVLETKTNEKEVVKKSIRKLLPFIGYNFVIGLIITFGFVLLIIPGIIFSLWYMFTLYLIFDKNMGLKESLSKSKMMVKGRMLKIFGRNIVFGLFSLLVTIIFSIIPYPFTLFTGLLSPLFMLPTYLLYKDVSNSLNN